ncbi:30S ribosome-binding factor RbfA [Parahaliea aestuarii]|uniref:Ribosome-binding factor A n=1 Tax=Parahaliea aestuarii TaxID=1852021 RepID=A0A5C9A4D0_9GAMM|nr:30S ribosome-binding factor RbfA [Parahaliea aestuarii]TXS94822.1 30S ribosome-binding factor RbfA [Parahaliea aestuarii]
MAKEYSRTQRVADYLQRELAALIQRELRDPRVGMVSITGVDVSRDLGHAKVFFTLLGADSSDDAAETAGVLNKAAGFLRSQLSRDSNMRMVPQLRFVFDSSVGYGRNMEDLIRRAADADRDLGLRDDEGDDTGERE